jgi:hypothetical protein
MSSAAYQVTITMDAATVAALNQSGFALFVFLAVQCSDQAGRPLVWSRTEAYTTSTVVSFAWDFEAYTAAWPAPAPVVPGVSIGVAPGDLFTVTQEPGGIGTVSGDGIPGDVSFLNATGTLCGCGTSQPGADGFAPVCLLPLHGGNAQVVVPLPKLLLLFSTSPDLAGTQVDATTGPVGPGLLVDMSAGGPYAVSYDIDAGWSWDEAPWGQAVPPFADLVALLVEPSPPLAVQALRLAAGPALRHAPA